MSDVSNFVIPDARGFFLVGGDVDLEVGEQRARFSLERAETGDRQAPLRAPACAGAPCRSPRRSAPAAPRRRARKRPARPPLPAPSPLPGAGRPESRAA